MMMDKIKALFQDSRKVDFYARWAIRIALFMGVAYLVFLKDTSRETVFIKQDEARDSLVILEYQIIEHRRNDSIIKVVKHETITRNAALPDDSLRASILRAIGTR